MADIQPIDSVQKGLDRATGREHTLSNDNSAAQAEALGLLKTHRSEKKSSFLPESLDAGSNKNLYPPEGTTSGDLHQTRSKLEQSLGAMQQTPEQNTQWQSDMRSFEKRMGHGQKAEVQKAYAEVQRLLDTPSTIVTSEVKQNVARDILHRAANSTRASQGDSLDCAAAGIENRLYTRSPADAARLVADATLTGQFRDSQGRTVTLDQKSISIHQNTEDPFKTGLEQRSHGDQIMQVIVRNEELTDVNSKLKYSIASHPGGSQEKVTDYSTNPPLDVSDTYGGMDPTNIEKVYKNLVTKPGANDSNFYIDDYSNTAANVAQFKQILDSMHGKYPVLMGVETSQEPFRTDMNMVNQPNQKHNITVEKYDPETATITYRNSNFGSREFSITADALYKATLNHMDDVEMRDSVYYFAHPDRDLNVDNRKDDVDIFQKIERAEPAQRNELYQRFKKNDAGIDINKYLTAAQKQELGLTD